ncbi:hypothetical protein M8J76_002946 [Diaphorina citri]|nr:hypothetical protein M8J76_002946 [Diaphorina citri]
MSSKMDRDGEEDVSGSSQNGERKKYKTRTRDRKERKLYTDDWTLGDDDIEGKRTFNLQDKLESDRFVQNFVKEMHGTDFNIGYLQRYGFSTPLLFREKTGLGLQVPSSSFSINDIRTSVGSRRPLDVMDVNTQKNLEMTMKEWQRYYEDPDKDRLLNVISLEFSHTKLENYVKQPSVVRQIDWVDCVWPRHLKEAQIEATNAIDEMKYPKVQKYCLMSVKGCYTDFHIDFGGTSVWYHILKGSKVFWLIPPTEHNIKLYEQWVLSGKQGDIFFGDTVERCGRITLTAGNTFFIPTGWVHAVYTPRDSLVFGGNFLHSYGIEKQLRVAKVEDTTKVPQKFRYPFFTEMLWYVLEKYVHCLLGKTHLATPDPHARLEKHASSGGHIHLTPHELHGLKAIVSYLHSLPGNKKSVPELIRDPVELIKDVRTLVEQHRYDSSEKSVTGRPVLRIVVDKEREMRLLLAKRYGNKEKKPKTSYYYQKKERERAGGGVEKERKLPKPLRVKPEGGPRRRRTRCKKCEACLQADCGECGFCQDMVKFGGQGRAKQTCVMRQCLQPMLPITAACSLCGLDGWGQPLVIPIQKTNKDTASTLMECSVCYQIVHPECLDKHFPNAEDLTFIYLYLYLLFYSQDTASTLMECSVCYQIVHPECLDKHFPNAEGMVNEDLPNSWECSKCCADGKNIEYKPRHFRARQKSSDFHRRSSDERLTPPPTKKIKKEKHSHHERERDRHRDRDSSNSASQVASPTLPIVEPPSTSQSHGPTVVGPPPEKKVALRAQLAQQLSRDSHKAMKRAMYVVRPAPVTAAIKKEPLPPVPTFSTTPAAGSLTTPPADTATTNGTGGSKKDKTSDATAEAQDSLALNKSVILPVFSYLSHSDLALCAAVCKTWSQLSVDPSLWTRMNLTGKHLTAHCLNGIVRRQPRALILDWTAIAKRQLAWLVVRLPQLKELSLQGCSYMGVAALRTCTCPPLLSLDLSFVNGMNDASLRDILSPPQDSRPGLHDTKSRLRNLTTLKLAGCDITDISLRYIVQNIPQLSHLDMSQCTRITDAAIAQLSTPPAPTIQSLVYLDVSGCHGLTSQSLELLARCENLKHIDLRYVPLISNQAVLNHVNNMGAERVLKIVENKLITTKNYK